MAAPPWDTVDDYPMITVDAHLHLWDHIDGWTAPDVRVQPLGNGMIQIGQQRMLGLPAAHLDCRAPAEWALSEFDAAGVDVGVIVQETLDGPQNEYLASVQQRWPDRFFVHALPDYLHIDQVPAEADRLFRRGFRGLKLPAMRLLGLCALDDARLMRVWDQMEQEQQVLAVDLAPDDSQAAMMDRIVRKHPRLRVAIGHFGMPTRGGWPPQLMLCKHENVHMECGGIVWLYRSEGYPFRGALWAIREAADAVGIDKLMWGSDWPRTMVDFTYRQSLDFLRADRSGAMTESEREKILGLNAARLYGLAQPPQPRRPVALITEG